MMGRRTFIKVVSGGALLSVAVPEMFGYLVARHGSLSPPPASTLAGFDVFASSIGQISTVGIGPTGVRLAGVLGRNGQHTGTTPHDSNHQFDRTADVKSFLSAVRRSDVLFILTALEDESCLLSARSLGMAACEAGVLTIAVSLSHSDLVNQSVSEKKSWYDTMFSISAESLPFRGAPGKILIDCGMCHLVSVIGNLLCNDFGFFIDPHNIRRIICDSGTGGMGVGMASGTGRGVVSVMKAIECLSGQGMQFSTASRALACLEASRKVSMEDIEAVSITVDDNIPADVDVIVGFLTDDQLGDSVKVTLLVVY